MKKVRCIKHPKRDLFITSKTEALDYVSNLSIFLFNLKLQDNINDDNSIKSRVLYLVLNPNNKKIKDEYNNLKIEILSQIKELSLLENTKDFNSLDEICHPFSHIMGMILKMYPSTFEDDSDLVREDLYHFGYFIGKWIYLIDALDDLKSDMENAQFNPYNVIYNKDNSTYKDLINKILFDIEFNILSAVSGCSEYLRKINFKKHEDILKNTIELGMINKYYEVLLKIQSYIKKEDVS